MSILVSGFEPFGEIAENPSQVVVAHLPTHIDIVKAILPVRYTALETQMQCLIAAHQPRFWLMLGVASGRVGIQLERLAVNLDDAAMADNDGVVRQGQPIVLDGPLAYASALPLDAFYGELKRRAIPVAYSNHAGTYLCNHAFYYGRYLGVVACGFVHLPSIGLQSPAMPLTQMIEAVWACVMVLTSRMTLSAIL